MALRIALIGAGLIGRKHIAKIAEHPDFELAGIADINRDAVAQQFPDASVFGDAEEMLDTITPDAVLIASPNQLHADNGIACARRGLPFIIEKPVTDTVESAARLAHEVRSAGVKTLVGHHRRHHLQVQKARELIHTGVIGNVVGISGIWATRKPESYFEAGAWRSQKGGGVILINLIHEIDFMRFTAGEIVAVSAVTSNRQRGFAVEDTAACLLEFDSGAIGTFLLTDSGVSPWTMEQGLGEVPDFPYSGENDYRFVGSKGSLEFPQMTQWMQENDVRNWNYPHIARKHFAGRVDPYTAQLSHFRDVISGKIPSVQTVEDGARTLIAAAAVSEAAEAGRRIDIRERYSALG
jgi:predicted dehydrogenase